MAYIGIDLGTTNTLIAIKRYKEDPEVLHARGSDISLEEESRFYIPSVVAYDSGELVAGWKALESVKTQPVIFSIKRLMGCGYNEKDKDGVLIHERVEKNWGYPVAIPKGGTGEDIVVKINGIEFTPQEISAAILREAVKIAEDTSKEEIEGAVISVPAYFNDKQRWATREAALLANLKVQKILSEPEAATKSYGLCFPGRSEQETILVYDFGGGTFDITLINITGTLFDVQDLDGDMWLGGDDFDFEIVKYLLSQTSSEIKEEIKSDQKRKFIPNERARDAKHKLSNLMEVNIRLDDTPLSNLDDLITKISREKFEELIYSKVEKTIKLVNDLLMRQACEPEWIDKVLLVGGSTRIPLVKKRLAEIFGDEKIVTKIDPMKAVAEGAAIESSWLLDKIECPNPKCNELVKKGNKYCSNGHPLPETIEITERPYGIEKFSIENGKSTFDEIIPKGKRYPLNTPAEKEYKITNSYARILKVPFYSGEKDEKTGRTFNSDISKNKHLGTIWMVLPKDISIPTNVKVRFNISNDRILEDVSVLCGDHKIEKVITRQSQEEKICTYTEQLLSNSNELFENLKSQQKENKVQEIVQKACDVISYVINDNLVKAESLSKSLNNEIEDLKKRTKSPLTTKGYKPPDEPHDPTKEAKKFLEYARGIHHRYSWLPYFNALVQEVMDESKDQWRINRQALLNFYHSQPNVLPTLESSQQLMEKYGRKTMGEILVIAEGQLSAVIQKEDLSEINNRIHVIEQLLLSDKGLLILLESHSAVHIAKEFSNRPVQDLERLNLTPSECISDAQKLEEATNKIEEFLKRGKVQEAEEIFKDGIDQLLLKYIIISFEAKTGRTPTEEEKAKAKQEIIITLPE